MGQGFDPPKIGRIHGMLAVLSLAVAGWPLGSILPAAPPCLNPWRPFVKSSHAS